MRSNTHTRSTHTQSRPETDDEIDAMDKGSGYDTENDSGSDFEDDDGDDMHHFMRDMDDIKAAGANLVNGKLVKHGGGRSKMQYQVLSKHKQKLQKQFLSGLEVGAHVSPETCIQIWNNKYVDFVDLLYPDDRGKMDVAYNGGGSVTLSECRPKEIRDILQWTDAFEIYASVYLEKLENQNKYHKLMTYARYVRKLASRGLNWREYDHQYRHDRPCYDDIPEWTGVRQDLVIDCIAEKLNGHFRSRDQGQYGDKSRGFG